MKYTNNLKALREARKLTLEQVAELSDLSVGYLSRLESGDRNLSLKTMTKLKKPLSAEPSQMIASAASIDKELALLPPEASRKLTEAFWNMIQATKLMGRTTD